MKFDLQSESRLLKHELSKYGYEVNIYPLKSGLPEAFEVLEDDYDVFDKPISLGYLRVFYRHVKRYTRLYGKKHLHEYSQEIVSKVKGVSIGSINEEDNK